MEISESFEVLPFRRRKLFFSQKYYLSKDKLNKKEANVVPTHTLFVDA